MGNSPCSDHICSVGYDKQRAIEGMTAKLAYNNKTTYRDEDGRHYVLASDDRKRYYYKVEEVANRSNQFLYHFILDSSRSSNL